MTIELCMDEIQTLIPPTLQHPGRVWIAGGYAAAPKLAGDLDLWVQLGDLPEMAAHTEEQWPLHPQLSSVSTALLMDASEYTESLKQRGIFKCGSAVYHHTLVVQVFGFKHSTVAELLEEFDISTHQVATDVISGERLTLATTTAPSELPRVTDWKTPANTRQRLERLLARYRPDILEESYWNHPDYRHLIDAELGGAAA